MENFYRCINEVRLLYKIIESINKTISYIDAADMKNQVLTLRYNFLYENTQVTNSALIQKLIRRFDIIISELTYDFYTPNKSLYMLFYGAEHQNNSTWFSKVYTSFMAKIGRLKGILQTYDFNDDSICDTKLTISSIGNRTYGKLQNTFSLDILEIKETAVFQDMIIDEDLLKYDEESIKEWMKENLL
jgi:hypothetical protein